MATSRTTRINPRRHTSLNPRDPGTIPPMAGFGPAPKDSTRRARRNKDPIGPTVLNFVHGEQPDLGTGPMDDGSWHPRTYEWWNVWGRTPLAANFTETDWQFLLDTAVLHTRFWCGDMKVVAELRLRVAKFGATPEDRARLRIVFADAEEKEDRRKGAGSSGQPAKGTTYGSLRAVSEKRKN